MCSYAIALHLELREHSDRNVILELKEEITNPKTSHVEEI